MPLPTVLFVDDDERLLESIKLVLRKEPYDIVTVSSIERARRVLEERAIDVIVCDERLPTHNGTTFLASLRDTHAAVRIVLSGAGIPTLQRAVNEADVFRFLTKPCAAKTIAEAVRDAIHFGFDCDPHGGK